MHLVYSRAISLSINPARQPTGYAFTVFLLSHGLVGASIVETIIRGLFAPFGHGIWSGVLGAILFRESTPHRFRITVPVILTYLFVSVLHGLWDGMPHTVYFVLPPGIPISVATLVLSVIGIVAIFVVYRQAITRHMQQPLSTNP